MSIYTVKTESKLLKTKAEQHSHLVSIDKNQRQVTSVLENQLQYLLNRKERDNAKKKKLLQLEEAYEKDRQSRISKMKQKTKQSEHLIQVSAKEREIKIKRNVQYLDKIKQKKQHQNQEEIQKMMNKRKQYSSRNSQSRSSKNSMSGSKVDLRMQSNSRALDYRSPQKDIDLEIKKIEAKIDKATTNNRFYQKQIAQKAKQYSKDFSIIRDKLRAKSVVEETNCFSNYYKHATHILLCKQKSKSFYISESEKRKKSIDEKFKKLNENLKYLNSARQQKIDKLQNKFNRSFVSKGWRNQKNTLYLERFLKNQRIIEQQKAVKADQIVKKHLDMSLKNKALRQKKDKIQQTMKKMQI